MGQHYPKWEDRIWSIPITNQMIAAMLDEMLAHNNLGEDFQVEVITHVTVDPGTGLITFFFTHSRQTNNILQFVPRELPEEAVSKTKPRRIPVREITSGP